MAKADKPYSPPLARPSPPMASAPFLFARVTRSGIMAAPVGGNDAIGLDCSA